MSRVFFCWLQLKLVRAISDHYVRIIFVLLWCLFRFFFWKRKETNNWQLIKICLVYFQLRPIPIVEGQSIPQQLVFLPQPQHQAITYQQFQASRDPYDAAYLKEVEDYDLTLEFQKVKISIQFDENCCLAYDGRKTLKTLLSCYIVWECLVDVFLKVQFAYFHQEAKQLQVKTGHLKV